MLALRETFRVFTINALFIFERPFVFACASAGAGFGWHKCVDGYIYTKKKIKKVVLYRGLLQGTLSPVNPLQGTPSPVIPLQGTPSPVNPLQGNSYRGLRPPLTPYRGTLTGDSVPRYPLAYGIVGLGIYAWLRIVTGFISVARLIVPVCRDGMTSRNSFLSSPKTGLLIFT